MVKRDDLEAVGELSGLVGLYLNDYAEKAVPDARSKLFHNGRPNAKAILYKAVQSGEIDDAIRAIPDNTSIDDIQLPPTKPTGNINQDELYSRPVSQPVLPQPSTTPVNTSQNIPPDNNIPGQLEFNFIDIKVKNFGTIGDVITYFNNRMDTLESEIKIIKRLVGEIKHILLEPK